MHCILRFACITVMPRQCYKYYLGNTVLRYPKAADVLQKQIWRLSCYGSTLGGVCLRPCSIELSFFLLLSILLRRSATIKPLIQRPHNPQYLQVLSPSSRAPMVSSSVTAIEMTKRRTSPESSSTYLKCWMQTPKRVDAASKRAARSSSLFSRWERVWLR